MSSCGVPCRFFLIDVHFLHLVQLPLHRDHADRGVVRDGVLVDGLAPLDVAHVAALAGLGEGGGGALLLGLFPPEKKREEKYNLINS